MTSGFSKYERKEPSQSIYCYPNTDVLINSANIMEASALAQYEGDVTAIRQYMLEEKPIKGRFGLTHLKRIHHCIFQDVYPFAGKLRLEDIWKGDTFFCKTQFIEDNLNSILRKLKEEGLLKRLGAKKFVERASFYLSELNMIHPFREGNGRTIREFIRCLGLRIGWKIDWSRLDSKELLHATIAAVDGNMEHLARLLYVTIATVSPMELLG